MRIFGGPRQEFDLLQVLVPYQLAGIHLEVSLLAYSNRNGYRVLVPMSAGGEGEATR